MWCLRPTSSRRCATSSSHSCISARTRSLAGSGEAAWNLRRYLLSRNWIRTWQSRYTDHGIMSTGFRDGKGDILADLSASCRKYGLKLGIYLSPADLFQIESPDGLYGNLSGYSLRTIPREVPGRPFKDTRKFEFYVDDYNEYFLNQLFELLTRAADRVRPRTRSLVRRSPSQAQGRAEVQLQGMERADTHPRP